MCIGWPAVLQITVSFGLLWALARLAACDVALLFTWLYAHQGDRR